MCVARRLGMTMCSGPILICNDWERLSKMAIGDPCMLLATWHYQFKQLRMVRKKILVWQLWRNWRTTGDPPVLLWSGADHHKGRRRKRQPRAACTVGKASCWAETTRSLAAAWFSCLSLLCLDLDTRNVRPHGCASRAETFIIENMDTDILFSRWSFLF
jgi:hypothetical protein